MTMMRKVLKENGLSLQVTLTSEEKLESPGSYSRLIRSAVDEAIRLKASDIHFEPTNKGFKIRLRVCGTLQVYYSSEKNIDLKILPDVLRGAMFTTLKAISNIPLGKQSEAQDSRISFTKRGIDVRVNKIPTEFGEKIVYRLFNKNESKKLTDAGFPIETYNDVRSAIQKKSGLIIITGETGSGKTSTIYSLIEEMDRERLNISTLENPVERHVEGVTHTGVTQKLGFSDGLRALLRQDPDVILVGEIRDETTAKLAVRAASTGHLVISTMHTNTALNIPKVFEYYGADQMQLMESLVLGANQRLIRKICPECSTSSDKKGGNFKTVNKSGCSKCSNGFLNERVLLFEYFTRDEINEKGGILLKRSIKELVIELAKKGVIDENEVHRHTH